MIIDFNPPPSPPICKWRGKSGKVYEYFIYELDFTFVGNQYGNYIYAKKNTEGKWVPVYIGHGDLDDNSRRHPRKVCILEKGATHIHVHSNPNDQYRRDEEKDMLDIATLTFAPNGCNEPNA